MTLLFFANAVAIVFGLVAFLLAVAVFLLAITGNVPAKHGSRYEYEEQPDEPQQI